MPFVVVPLAISLLKVYKDNPILSHCVPHLALSFLFIKFSMRSPLQAIPNMPTSVQKTIYRRILFSTVSTPLIPHTRRFPSPRPTPRAWWCIVLFWFTAPSLNYYHPRRRRSPPLHVAHRLSTTTASQRAPHSYASLRRQPRLHHVPWSSFSSPTTTFVPFQVSHLVLMLTINGKP